MAGEQNEVEDWILGMKVEDLRNYITENFAEETLANDPSKISVKSWKKKSLQEWLHKNLSHRVRGGNNDGDVNARKVVIYPIMKRKHWLLWRLAGIGTLIMRLQNDKDPIDHMEGRRVILPLKSKSKVKLDPRKHCVVCNKNQAKVVCTTCGAAAMRQSRSGEGGEVTGLFDAPKGAAIRKKILDMCADEDEQESCLRLAGSPLFCSQGCFRMFHSVLEEDLRLMLCNYFESASPGLYGDNACDSIDLLPGSVSIKSDLEVPPASMELPEWNHLKTETIKHHRNAQETIKKENTPSNKRLVSDAFRSRGGQENVAFSCHELLKKANEMKSNNVSMFNLLGGMLPIDDAIDLLKMMAEKMDSEQRRRESQDEEDALKKRKSEGEDGTTRKRRKSDDHGNDTRSEAR